MSDNNKPLYSHVYQDFKPSEKPHAVNGCEPIFILSAVDVQPLDVNTLFLDFITTQLRHPVWRKKSFYEFLQYQAAMYASKYRITSYDTAYFLQEDLGVEYAKANTADINECGAYPYLVLYSRPIDHMYCEIYDCLVRIFKYDRDTDTYMEITNFDEDEVYNYIANFFEQNYKAPVEVDDLETLKEKYPEEEIKKLTKELLNSFYGSKNMKTPDTNPDTNTDA